MKEYDKDKNIINIFAAHHNKNSESNNENIRYFAGFNYVKINKDKNGNKFNKERLISYAEKCHYIVSVMRELDGEIWLYNYDVKNDELAQFIKAFELNTLNGKIIEIEKYFPEDLA